MARRASWPPWRRLRPLGRRPRPGSSEYRYPQTPPKLHVVPSRAGANRAPTARLGARQAPVPGPCDSRGAAGVEHRPPVSCSPSPPSPARSYRPGPSRTARSGFLVLTRLMPPPGCSYWTRPGAIGRRGLGARRGLAAQCFATRTTENSSCPRVQKPISTDVAVGLVITPLPTAPRTRLQVVCPHRGAPLDAQSP